MVSGDNVTVTLTGGAPWGFRLTGGGSLPLQISKIRKKSQAHLQGLREGDAVVSINGTPVHDRTHDQAIDLIDSSGETLTLQLYRGDADDLGQLLGNIKPATTLTPLLPFASTAGQSSGVTTASSTILDDGATRRQVQEEHFVEKDGDTERQTFVRRELTSTVSTIGPGPTVTSNDVQKASTSSTLQTTSISTTLRSSVSPTPQVVQISLSPGPQLQQPPPIQLKPAAPTVAPKPTFKALPPRIAPEDPISAAPEGLLKPVSVVPPAVAPKPTFKAIPPASTAVFSPGKFQVSTTAMYSTNIQDTYSPGKMPSYSPGNQQPFPESRQQQNFVSGSQQKTYFANRQQQTYPPSNQLFSPGSQQSQSPVSLSSPVSSSQPFSPSSPINTPMFNVRSYVKGDRSKDTWAPNMWLPGQEPDKTQSPQQQQPQQQQTQIEKADAPRRLTVKERQQMLLQQTATNHHSLGARQRETFSSAVQQEEEPLVDSALLAHVFAPSVEITPWQQSHYVNVLLGLERADSPESEPSSPSSSLIRRKKKLYADSTFYEDPEHKYPTIDEQMKLCRLISKSLTSAANRKARGAKMFAKRKRKSAHWVHEGHSERSSSAGDVANIEELDSELSPEEGGSKSLFYFRIPTIKHRVSSPELNTKMSMKKDEFERLRLQAAKCDHRVVSPGTCFDIVADLKSHKGRGGRLFERRKNRADKFIIDESNAKIPEPRTPRLEDLLTSPLKSSKSPWEAAEVDESGRVDAAFDHLTDLEKNQKLTQILKYTPPASAPRRVSEPTENVTVPYSGPVTNLRSSSPAHLLQGRNFNRVAKGWCGAGGEIHHRVSTTTSTTHEIIKPSDLVDMNIAAHVASRNTKVHYGDYNPRPKAWQAAQHEESHSCPASMTTSWTSDTSATYPVNGHGAEELPASDL